MTDGRGGEKGIGYRRPPFATRFKKGQSGNLRGRPRGRTRELPYEAVLGQMVTIRDGGVEKRLPADEAFLLYMMKNGLGEDVTAARTLLGTMEQADAVGWTVRPNAVRSHRARDLGARLDLQYTRTVAHGDDPRSFS